VSYLAIRTDQLSKCYRVGERVVHRDLREALTAAAGGVIHQVTRHAPAGREREARAERDIIWALRDVSLEIRAGEVVGLIGRNGAGKSTLLKILSRTTKPTRGAAEIRGRIGSLLEVGTGFHPELTGRENVFLNGSVLGMRKAEIARKFDEIVSFSGVERFIDTPVKRYSSGMYVRLAFAVAAHLEPEILLVDEVLAVGDIDFQKKCIEKMESTAKSGRTVVVVSHNLAIIESLCPTSILLERGGVSAIGPTNDVIARYTDRLSAPPDWSLSDGRGSGDARFTGIELCDMYGRPVSEVRMGDGLIVRLHVEAQHPIRQPWVSIDIRTPFDQLIFHFANREAGFELALLEGSSVIECRIPSLNLIPGRFRFDLLLADMSHHVYHRVDGAATIDIRPADVLQSGMALDHEYGLVFYPSAWKVYAEATHEMRRDA
jgi:lipopolysaccharide transport system ATP-binding protein